MRYHRAPNPEDTGKFIVVRRTDAGYWLDDFEEVFRVLPSDEEILVRYVRTKIAAGSN
jgi:hypothetical protein